MGWPIQAAMLAGLALIAWILARFPRALFTEAGETPHARRAEYGLAGGLAVAGGALFEAFPAGAPASRFGAAALAMVFCAAIYADLRYLVIPDLYSAAVAAGGVTLNLASPAGKGPHGVLEMAIGAGLCGGLLFAVAWVWKKRTDIEGLGFGDVKLAAAMGALLGMQAGVWAITASAAGGAVLGFILQARASDPEAPLLFPYGAPLSLAGAGFLLWERWT